VISLYLEALSGSLRFDPALARRVRREVEDHLQQAVAADLAHRGAAAERRAIIAFGDAQIIAGQFAAIWIAGQMKRFGIALVLVIASVFVAMKGRVAWYAAMGGGAGHDASAMATIVASIDRYAFWLSVIIGAGSFAYLVSRPLPAPAGARYRKQLRCVLVSGAAAIAPLMLAVLSDGVLTAMPLLGADLRVASLVPLGTMAIEIACVGFLVFHFWVVRLRTRAATALLTST